MNKTKRKDLCHLIELIEQLEEKKSYIAADIREMYAEAKGAGFDPRIVRKMIQIRERNMAPYFDESLGAEEEKNLLKTYKQARKP